MSDIIANAAAAEQTRNDGPPPVDAQAAANQWRLHEMTGGAYKPTMPKPEALKPPPPAKTAAEQREAERVAKLPPAERRRQELTKELTSSKFTAAECEAKSKELRQVIVSMTTPEEAEAWANTPLSEQRAVYGLEPPTLPTPDLVAAYEEHYGWAESELITVARNEGLDAATVRGLRDAVVNLGLQVDGRPLADDVVDAALKKYKLTDAQRAKFKKLYRDLEGGGAA